LRRRSQIGRPWARAASHTIRLRDPRAIVCEHLLDGDGLQREDDISECVVLELVSLDAIENDGAGLLFALCRISGIDLCMEFDLARFAIHLVRNEEVVMK
jgi:hypothetical protein